MIQNLTTIHNPHARRNRIQRKRLSPVHVFDAQTDRPISPALMVLAWLWVLVPSCYGLYQLVIKIPALFGH